MEEYKRNLTTVFFKSQEEFEKRLSLLSASGFGASVFLIENVVGKLSEVSYIWILVISWIFLGFTLLLNLISHVISANKTWNTLNDILTNKYDCKIALKRHHFVQNLNYSCIGLLCIGLIFLILFFTLNI
jgi:hypothetical protein